VVFTLAYDAAAAAFDRWISWARRRAGSAFVKLQKRIVKHRPRILATIEHNLSNVLIESTSRLTAFGFKSPLRHSLSSPCSP
jgi:transposase